MKVLQVYKFIFSNDSMRNRKLNFSVIRNMTLGMYLSVWWVTLFLRIRYWGQVVEASFCLIFVKLLILISCWRFFLSLPAESYIMKMCCPCITILEYTSQNKKFENFINIRFNKKKTLRRSWITHFKKRPQEKYSIKKLFWKIWQYSP